MTPSTGVKRVYHGHRWFEVVEPAVDKEDEVMVGIPIMFCDAGKHKRDTLDCPSKLFYELRIPIKN